MSKIKIVLTVILSPMLLWAKPRDFASSTVDAPADAKISVEAVSGTGCPEGTARVVLSPDSSVMSVLFDQFITEITPGEGERRARKNCEISLRISYSGQYRVAIVGSDIRGYAGIPAGGRSVIKVQHIPAFAANHPNWKRMDMRENLVGPLNEDIFMEVKFKDRPGWSRCGTEASSDGFTLMGINMIIESANRSKTETLVTTIDSMDSAASAGLQYRLAWMPDKMNCPGKGKGRIKF